MANDEQRTASEDPAHNCRRPTTGRIVLTLELNGEPVRTLLDTGCTTTIIAKYALDDRNFLIKPTGRITMSGLAGPVREVLGTVDVELQIGKIVIPMECIAEVKDPLDSFPIVAGMDLLTKFETIRIHPEERTEFIGYPSDAWRKPRTLELDINIAGVELTEALLDTGSQNNLIRRSVIEDLIANKGVEVKAICGCITHYASGGFPMPILGIVELNLNVDGEAFERMEFYVYEELSDDVVLGMKLLGKFKTIEINFCDCGDQSIRLLERIPEPTPTAMPGAPQKHDAAPTPVLEGDATGSHGNESKPGQPTPAAAEANDEKQPSNPTQPAAEKNAPETA